jgi:hypothetical protein
MRSMAMHRGTKVLLCTILVTGITSWSGAQAGQLPQNNYMIHCQGCHLPDGTGTPPDVPSFANQLFQFLRVEGGRAYLVQVPGTANAPLDDHEVAELLNWMLDRFSDRSLPADFVPYSEKEIARYRSEVLIDPATRRQSLLTALSGQVVR